MLKSRANIEEFFADLRTAAKETLDEAAGKIMSYEPEIVGLSSTFMQNNASIALMKRLKEINPSIVTMMGGANCMGTAGRASLKKFPCIDYICLGEADEFFADVCRKILNGEKDFPLPYGLLRQGEEIPEGLLDAAVSGLSEQLFSAFIFLLFEVGKFF